MPVTLEKTTENAGKVKVVGTVNLTRSQTTAKQRTFSSAIRNNVPSTLVLGKKRADFHELNDCSVFLRDNCKDCAIDVQKRTIAKLEMGKFSARVNGCMDALKNHHRWKVIPVATLEK